MYPTGYETAHHGGYQNHHVAHPHANQKYGAVPRKSNLDQPRSPLSIRCCDPYNQKVYDVPQHFVEDTQGKHTYTNNPSGRRAQICMKYQDGQCNMKARCQQIHADRTWVQELRARFYDSRKVYVSDIAAHDLETGEVLAFKYSEVDSCLAKDKYRTIPHTNRPGFVVCREYAAMSTCALGRNCNYLHVSPEKYGKVVAQQVPGFCRTPPSNRIASAPNTPTTPGMSSLYTQFDEAVTPSSSFSGLHSPLLPSTPPPTAYCSPISMAPHMMGGYDPYSPMSPTNACLFPIHTGSTSHDVYHQQEYSMSQHQQDSHLDQEIEGYYDLGVGHRVVVPHSERVERIRDCDIGDTILITAVEERGRTPSRDSTDGDSSTPTSRPHSAPPTVRSSDSSIDLTAVGSELSRQHSRSRSLSRRDRD